MAPSVLTGAAPGSARPDGPRRTSRAILRLVLGLAVAGCAAAPADRAPAPVPQPPAGSAPDAEGRCWATEPVPAIYEQVGGEIMVIPAETAPDGTVLQAPVYRRAMVPRLVRPRGEMRFEAPCPAVMTPAFIASLQRALAARGFYVGAPTGRMDGSTRSAVRQYQAGKGLNSDQLSIETARALGLVVVPRSSLE
ncbi:peptidoglycan-binding domain-containing protein [Citreimonas salinaria]|uniref:Putative peptidoglycan binding domain-containing protein n=1 Tax=Citreimonas salinaria TaxID=321339 RepID=A0A1H3H8B7_9RHOB|nr:peptidoglycan-binding domain-containing protein [Citreimonas salinaria]SDY11752.1 Putative peptidoglycan binding domain-containing protein [Citreimonas salinaria]